MFAHRRADNPEPGQKSTKSGHMDQRAASSYWRAMPESEHQAIVLALPMEAGWARAIARGAAAAARQFPGWVLQTSGEGRAALAQLAHAPPRGLIVALTSARQAERCAALRRLGVAVVNVGFLLPSARLPHVGNDDAAIGRLAGEHLLQAGLSHFGFLGVRGLRVSALRQEGFTQAVSRVGYSVSTHFHPAVRRSSARAGLDGRLAAWLRGLPKPVGILGWCDSAAARITRTCQIMGLRVPEEVAVVGADNDLTVCQLSTPPLSSVAVPMERIGHEAAMLLGRLIRGSNTRHSALFISPLGVVPRRSSDVAAVADPELAAALRWIRENARRGVGVDDLVAAISLSRSTLQRRFRGLLGRTPAAELRRARLALAKQLLAETDLPLNEVARQSGFRRVEYLHALFHAQVEMTPLSYRRQFRPSPVGQELGGSASVRPRKPVRESPA
jgi:LacI family transcriptional regulator